MASTSDGEADPDVDAAVLMGDGTASAGGARILVDEALGRG